VWVVSCHIFAILNNSLIFFILSKFSVMFVPFSAIPIPLLQFCNFSIYLQFLPYSPIFSHFLPFPINYATFCPVLPHSTIFSHFLLFCHFPPVSPTFCHFLPHSATFCSFQPLSAIFCHFIPFPAIFYHFPPLSAIFCHILPF
jgi:hypothetical protein